MGVSLREGVSHVIGCVSSSLGSHISFFSSDLLAFVSPDPPYISKAKNTGVSVGQKGILSCEASAVPMAEFQWFKEDTRYLEGTGESSDEELINHASPLEGE